MAEQANYKHLVRIANTDLDGSKAISIALTKIKGVGKMYANMVCIVAKVPKTEKAGVIADEKVRLMEEVIQNPAKFKVPSWMMNRRRDIYDGADKHLITSDLTFQKDNDIKTLKKIRCYRGVRHMDNLPVRGQRTKSNFRRNKGKVQGVKKNKDAKAGK
ncbi:30S ribosomal protein S13 [Candidatus Woesearchaeota archaeon]|nr:30S ribosomal protein S13 [Candidatus Woesearchaeota archaeon]